MSDGEEKLEFPSKEWEKLFEEVKARITRHTPGGEICGLMNHIVGSRTIQPEDIPWQIAVQVIPGFSDAMKQFLHKLCHLAFEIGRQWEIDARNIRFDDLTVEDLKE